MPYDSLVRAGCVLACSVLLGACASVPVRGTSLGYNLDSPSAACRNSLSACVALYGKEVASVSAVLRVALDKTTKDSIDKALSECADLARSEVLLRHQGDFEGLSPNAVECNEPAKNAKRKDVTWAMQLGTEMHEVALECAGKRLGELRPKGFSLEPRYRYDTKTGRWKLVSPAEERALEETGNIGELKGSLKPDVVIHQGDPLNPQEVYDFKFPCVNTDVAPPWSEYPDDHPYTGLDQGEVYGEMLAPNPARVVPRLGVIR